MENKWITVSNPEKELPKDRMLWVTTKYGNVMKLYYDMTEWSEPIHSVIAYMDYSEPEPYVPSDAGNEWDKLSKMLFDTLNLIAEADEGGKNIKAIRARNEALADLLMEIILFMLPDFENDYDDETDFYAENGRILSRGEQQTATVDDFIEHIVMGYGFHVMQSGFCDPAEDELMGRTDKYTGFGYIDWE